MPTAADLVALLYPALAAGDRAAVLAVLRPDFTAEFTAGLPDPIGGAKAGAEEAIERGWWAIGARFAVRAEPAAWLPCTDGHLVVTGTYRGHGRASGRAFEAAFAHVWTADGDRLASLIQYTDSARWWAALREDG